MTDATEPELAPCPFCGSDDIALIAYHWARCRKCDCRIAAKAGGHIVDAWNTRAHPPEIERLIEAASNLSRVEIQDAARLRGITETEIVQHRRAWHPLFAEVIEALDAVRPGWREKA